MLLRFGRFWDPIAILYGNSELRFEAIDGPEKGQTLTDGNYTNIFESFVIEEDKNVTSDAI